MQVMGGNIAYMVRFFKKQLLKGRTGLRHTWFTASHPLAVEQVEVLPFPIVLPYTLLPLALCRGSISEPQAWATLTFVRTQLLQPAGAAGSSNGSSGSSSNGNGTGDSASSSSSRPPACLVPSVARALGLGPGAEGVGQEQELLFPVTREVTDRWVLGPRSWVGWCGE